MAANARRRAGSVSEQDQELVGEIVGDVIVTRPARKPRKAKAKQITAQAKPKRRRRNGNSLASVTIGEAWATVNGVLGWLRSL